VCERERAERRGGTGPNVNKRRRYVWLERAREGIEGGGRSRGVNCINLKSLKAGLCLGSSLK
jgi:hypothetical protein